MSRGRQSSFDPRLIAKYQRCFRGGDDKIVSMYARSVSTEGIAGHLPELYGIDVSPDPISTVALTRRALAASGLVKSQRSRRLPTKAGDRAGRLFVPRRISTTSLGMVVSIFRISWAKRIAPGSTLSDHRRFHEILPLLTTPNSFPCQRFATIQPPVWRNNRSIPSSARV